ncbi:Arf-GAP with SH3 domain, ANK repeat and PH domain-containing protein 1 [Homalodisca vitripennis]|nr:Arf-GAP with SH3 domain, ANK repeat and PH domain-containing protein 1 [Homalodisca vitripennis]
MNITRLNVSYIKKLNLSPHFTTGGAMLASLNLAQSRQTSYLRGLTLPSGYARTIQRPRGPPPPAPNTLPSSRMSNGQSTESISSLMSDIESSAAHNPVPPPRKKKPESSKLESYAEESELPEHTHADFHITKTSCAETMAGCCRTLRDSEIDLVISSDCDDSSECSDVPELCEVVSGIEDVVRSDHSGRGSDGEPDNDLHQVTAQQTTRRPAVRVPPPWSRTINFIEPIYINYNDRTTFITVHFLVKNSVSFGCANVVCRLRAVRSRSLFNMSNSAGDVSACRSK